MHICVLGAGVIGVTTAHRLLQDGHRVTLIDTQANPGSGASFANGAQLSYSYVAPLADASLWSKWPSYLFSRESPLTLRPTPDRAQWAWLARFLAACTSPRARETTVRLLRLAFFSRSEMARLREREPLDFLHRVAGKLVMFSDQASLESARRQVAFQAQHGCRQQVLDMAGCMAVEPALSQASRQWVGGVYTPDEEVGDCELFCRGLFASMTRHSDFRFVCASVQAPRVVDDRLRSVRAGEEEIGADAFVLALGAQSAPFARAAGFSLPVYPLKGYSITIPLGGEPCRAPSVSITDMARKIVYARLGEQLRVAGRVELVGLDDQVPQRAVDELKYSVAALFPNCAKLDDDAALAPWSGFRPATPGGLPLIGASPLANLYLNVGHGSLGWTLACGSAGLLADQIAGREPAVDPAPFRYSQASRAGVPA
jgi:D-amino-acid dehydrogenase